MRRHVVLTALIMLEPVVAHAQGFTAGTIDAVVTNFQTTMTGWEPRLQAVAQQTFGILALIGFAWAMIRQALRNADLSEFLAAIVQQIFFIGFWWWALTTTQTWGPAIINSFKSAANTASGVAVTHPGDVFNIGWQISSKIIAQMSVWSPTASVGLLFAGMVIMVVFALICASMVLVLVQSYFIISGGVLLMAFGGSSFTSEIAVTVIRQTFAIGAKLFALILIVAIGMNFLQQAAASFDAVSGQAILAQIGEAVVLLVLAHEVPQMVERMLGGVGFAGAGSLVGAASSVATTTVYAASAAYRGAGGAAAAGRVVLGLPARPANSVGIGGASSRDLGVRFSGGQRRS
jgi:type IV secretion system protein TrbL